MLYKEIKTRFGETAVFLSKWIVFLFFISGAILLHFLDFPVTATFFIKGLAFLAILNFVYGIIVFFICKSLQQSLFNPIFWIFDFFLVDLLVLWTGGGASYFYFLFYFLIVLLIFIPNQYWVLGATFLIVLFCYLMTLPLSSSLLGNVQLMPLNMFLLNVASYILLAVIVSFLNLNTLADLITREGKRQAEKDYEKILRISRQQSENLDQVRNELNQKIRELTTLYDITTEISSTLDREELLKKIVSCCKEEMNSEISFLMMEERGDLSIKYSQGLMELSRDIFTCSVAEGPFGEVVTKGTPILANKKDGHPVFKALLGVKENLRDILVVAMKSPRKKQAIGLIGVANCLTPTGFTSKHQELLSIIATQAAVSLDNVSLYEKLKLLFEETISTMVATIETKHEDVGVFHTQNVKEIAVGVAMEMVKENKMTPIEVEYVKYAALLHDIGKFAIPDEVLRKPDALSEEDIKLIRQHPQKGASIVERITPLKDAVPYIKYHHECYDGSGYPEGLKGDDIPLGAQIIAIADTFDALRMARPYKQAFSFKQAIEIIQKETNKKFRPDVVEAFIRFASRLREEEFLRIMEKL